MLMKSSTFEIIRTSIIADISAHLGFWAVCVTIMVPPCNPMDWDDEDKDLNGPYARMHEREPSIPRIFPPALLSPLRVSFPEYPDLTPHMNESVLIPLSPTPLSPLRHNLLNTTFSIDEPNPVHFDPLSDNNQGATMTHLTVTNPDRTPSTSASSHYSQPESACPNSLLASYPDVSGHQNDMPPTNPWRQQSQPDVLDNSRVQSINDVHVHPTQHNSIVSTQSIAWGHNRHNTDSTIFSQDTTNTEWNERRQSTTESQAEQLSHRRVSSGDSQNSTGTFGVGPIEEVGKARRLTVMSVRRQTLVDFGGSWRLRTKVAVPRERIGSRDDTWPLVV